MYKFLDLIRICSETISSKFVYQVFEKYNFLMTGRGAVQQLAGDVQRVGRAVHPQAADIQLRRQGYPGGRCLVRYSNS